MASETMKVIEADRLQKLGGELGRVYNLLWYEYAWLQVKWGEYRELFGTSEERVRLLDSAAGFFFRTIHGVLWEDTLLHLCRLTDRDKRTVSIMALPALCPSQPLRRQVSDLVKKAEVATKFARTPRNVLIAHSSLKAALSQTAKPLGLGSRKEIEAALYAIHRVLNHIHLTLLEGELAWARPVPPSGSIALLSLLRDGLDAQNARMKRLGAGRPELGDLERPAI